MISTVGMILYPLILWILTFKRAKIWSSIIGGIITILITLTVGLYIYGLFYNFDSATDYGCLPDMIIKNSLFDGH